MLTAAPSRDTAVDSSFGIGEIFLTFGPTLHSDSGGQFPHANMSGIVSSYSYSLWLAMVRRRRHIYHEEGERKYYLMVYSHSATHFDRT